MAKAGDMRKLWHEAMAREWRQLQAIMQEKRAGRVPEPRSLGAEPDER